MNNDPNCESDETRSDVGGEYRGDSVDEDTEDASETEDYDTNLRNAENMNTSYDDYYAHHHHQRNQQQSSYQMREQAYQEKKKQYLDELAAVDNGTHPLLIEGLKRLKAEHDERMFLIDCFEESETRRINKEFQDEYDAAWREFNERTAELKESLLQENEEKHKAVELDTIEVSSEPADSKPLTTRKLRRRPNEPVPIPDRRRRPSPANILYQLDDDQINEDLKMISKFFPSNKSKGNNPSSSTLGEGSSSRSQSMDIDGSNQADARIEDNKLHYEKKWYLRGQHVILESSDGTKNNTSISHVGSNEIVFKRPNDPVKFKVSLGDLINKKYTIRKG